MKKSNFFVSVGIVFTVAVLFFSCNKINLATELGQDLIPEVDNVHTFDTLLDIASFNQMFTSANDTFRTNASNSQILGIINNDPIFGKTDARMFFQVAPLASSNTGSVYPFKNTPSKLVLDSVVLIVDYTGTYGDSTLAQTIQVSEISQENDFRYDSSYQLSKNLTTSTVLGSKSLTPATLHDSIRVINYPDTMAISSQLRITLDKGFGERLLAYDSTGMNNAYSSDSVFKTKFKGLALQSIGSGNGLMAFNLNNTSLALYYRYENTTTAGDMDTSVAYMPFASTSAVGYTNACANYIKRDYAGTTLLSSFNDDIADPLVYIQQTPGTFANLQIPAIATLPNCVVHLAELQMESVYDPMDMIFNANYPFDLFLDVKYDSVPEKHKLVPYGFSRVTSSLITGNQYSLTLGDFDNFYSAKTQGQRYYYKTDPLGNQVKQWRFNITRYVQNIVNKKAPLYTFRLYAPAFEALPIGDGNFNENLNYRAPIPQAGDVFPGYGRVRLGGGNNPSQKMKLRIVYSKLQ